jgi:hypothetical protein
MWVEAQELHIPQLKAKKEIKISASVCIYKILACLLDHLDVSFSEFLLI